MRWTTPIGIFVLMAAAISPARPAEVAGAPAEAPKRDILASLFLYPFLTDAEVEYRVSDTRARIRCSGGPVLFRYPGISAVSVGGNRVAATVLGNDLLRVDLPAGSTVVDIETGATSGRGRASEPTSGAVSTPQAFQEAAASLKPGDTLIVRDGVYSDWQLSVNAAGTAERPVVVRPETPGGVTFRRGTRIAIGGSHVVLRGFRFEQCGPDTVVRLENARDCRVTQCHFLHCGNPVSTFAHIVRIDLGSDRCRVDNCFFTGSKSMSLAQRIAGPDRLGRDNRFDHNIFRDIFRYWINGQENIQIGQNQRGVTGAAQPHLAAEFNLFDHAWGDGEILSNKSTGNVIRWNVAAHCFRSAFTLRGGDGVRFEGNVMWNNGDGLRVMGKRHEIVDNLFLPHPQRGIYFETGSADGDQQVASDDTLIANNTFIGLAQGAIGGMVPTEARPHRATRISFVNNLFTGATGVLLDTEHLLESSIRSNLFRAEGAARAGETGTRAVLADPLLRGAGMDVRPGAGSPALRAGERVQAVTHDRWGRLRPTDGPPDIGADQVSVVAGGKVSLHELPPLPAQPLVSPELYFGSTVWEQDAERPVAGWRPAAGVAADGAALKFSGAGATLDRGLPGDFVLQWEYRPETFAATATLRFGTTDTGDGYAITWGGADPAGKPRGRIDLTRGSTKEPFADGADVLNYYLDYQPQAWLGGTRNTRTAPDPEQWYRFTLLKRGGRAILLQGDARRGGPDIPVLVSDDREAHGVPAGGARLQIAQTGTGYWRNVRLREYAYRGDIVPSAPAHLRASARGVSRIEIAWEAEPGIVYDVLRSETGAGAGDAVRIASRTAASTWNDFDFVPGRTYHYTVRGVNPLGKTSPDAAVSVASGSGGPFYRAVSAATAQIVAPMARAGTASQAAIEVTPGTPPAMSGAPAEGGAEFRFATEKAGEYTLWGLVQTQDEGSDSFYAALDRGAFNTWYTGIHPTWGWSRIAGPVRLEPGEHVLRVKHREPRARLSTLLVTDDPTFGK